MATLQEVSWHENACNNWKKSLDTHEARILKELDKIKEDRTRLDFYMFQIYSAKVEHKEKFDRDKYKKPRNRL